MEKKKKLLIINPGSTSTKVALYEERTPVLERDLMVDLEKIKDCVRMIDQLQLRLDTVKDFIKEEKINMSEVDMIVARGGSINGVKSDAYMITEHVETMLRYAPRSQHVSSLAGIIAYILGKEYGIPSMFYDGVSADDADEIMHYTGIPEVKRFVTSHCLNSKMVAREIAEEMGKKYEDCNMITVHMGGGITMAFHSGGRMIDTLLDDAGPMSPQRAGRIPVTDVINMCYSGRYSKEEMAHKMRGNSGLVAYFGVHDARSVEKMIAQGDEKAKMIYWYMAYQIAKGIGELSVCNSGKMDCIILTGGLAYSEMLVKWISDRVSFLAPVKVIPGEHEMQALANGGMRVLLNEELPKEYTWVPEGYSDYKEFLEACIQKSDYVE